MISTHGEGAVGKASVVESRPMVVELYMSKWLDNIKTSPIPPPKGGWTLSVDRAGGGHEEYSVSFAGDPSPKVTLTSGDQPVVRLAIQDRTGHMWCWADFT